MGNKNNGQLRPVSIGGCHEFVTAISVLNKH